MRLNLRIEFDEDQLYRLAEIVSGGDRMHQNVLAKINYKLEKIMATVQDVKDAVATEAAEVKARIDALAAEVQALKDQIAAGTAATPEQLDEILLSVQGIFTPAV